MTDLRITRTFAAPPELVFDFLTRRRHLLDWWGYGFFDIGGDCVVWETTHLTAVDYEGLLQRVRFL
jgi:uncharacterized protein YndB with AHSA1/START domain